MTKIEKSLSQLCYQKEAKKSQIEGFRDLYKKHLEDVKKLPNNYLNA